MTSSQWVLIRSALAETAERFLQLLRSVHEPGARAVGEWTIGDVAAHIREVTLLNSLFATGAPPPDDVRALYDRAATAAVDEVGEVNALALSMLTERRAAALAPIIEAQVGQLLERTAGNDGDETIAWLGGIKMPVRAVLGHTLSELFVHGNDIARAEGRSFPIPRAHAGLIFDAFLFELLGSPDAARFAGDRAGAMRPVTCEFRLRGSAPRLLVAEWGQTTVEAAGTRAPDVHIAADPAALWLVMCGRTSPAGAALRGRLVMWGRRPWRLRHLMEMLHTP